MKSGKPAQAGLIEETLADRIMNFLLRFPYNMSPKEAEEMLAALPAAALTEVQQIVQMGYIFTPETIRFFLAIKQILKDIKDTEVTPISTVQLMLTALLNKLYGITRQPGRGEEITRSLALYIVEIIDHHADLMPHDKMALYKHLMWQRIFDNQTLPGYYINRTFSLFASTWMLSDTQKIFQMMHDHLKKLMNPNQTVLKK
jgi:hypothetical protein